MDLNADLNRVPNKSHSNRSQNYTLSHTKRNRGHLPDPGNPNLPPNVPGPSHGEKDTLLIKWNYLG